MGFFYFDESIHPNGKFALGALAYAEHDLQEVVAEALREAGMAPRIDEFKSGARMDRSPAQRCAREHLRSIVRGHCRIGIVVAPHLPGNSLALRRCTDLRRFCR